MYRLLQSLRLELEREQEQVNNLQNMVVVVDESSCDTAYQQLEKQLESLGQRWANVCKWVEEQWQILQEVLSKWKHFSGEQRQFNQWLEEKEHVLAQMCSVDMRDVNEVIEQVRQLKVSRCCSRSY